MTRPGASMPSTADTPATEPAPALSIPMQVIGLVIACWAGVLLALVGAFLTPFQVGTVRVPVSLVLVVGGLIGITRFTRMVVENMWLCLVPGVIWLIVSLVFSGRTTEGDLVLTEQNWVSVLYPLVGSITIGLLAYRMILAKRPGRPGAR